MRQAVFAAAVAGAGVLANPAISEEIDCVSTVVVEPDYEYSFWTWTLSQRPKALDTIPDTEDFDNTGLHKLNIYATGANAAGYCLVEIDAVNKKSGKLLPILSSRVGVNDDDVVLGDTYAKVFEDIQYSFTFEKCNNFVISTEDIQTIRITRDLTNSGIQCKGKDGVLSPVDNNPVLSWDMTGFTKVIPNGRPRVVIVNPGADKEVSTEYSQSREVGFSITEGRAKSAGINLAILHGELQRSVDRSSEAKFEETLTYVFSVTLKGENCNAWRVDPIRTVELGRVSAPQFGVNKPLDFYVTLGQDIIETPLCEGDSTIATPERIEQERAAILELTQ